MLGAVCWVLGVEWFVAQVIAQAAWKRPFSLTHNYVSDLGATTCAQATIPVSRYVCSPLHDVMNASFVLLGLLALVGIVLTRSTWPRRRFTKSGLMLLVLFGLGKIVVGFAPEDTLPAIHGLGALGILWGNIGVVFLGLASWPTMRWLAVGSICVGAVGTVGFLLLFVAPSLGVGTLERIADYPVPVWLAVLGLAMAGNRKAR